VALSRREDTHQFNFGVNHILGGCRAHRIAKRFRKRTSWAFEADDLQVWKRENGKFVGKVAVGSAGEGGGSARCRHQREERIIVVQGITVFKSDHVERD